MSIQRLEILNKVVQLQNITKAAESLNISQSGISYAIKALEDELEVHILKRSRTGVQLTKEGEAIYQHSLLVTKAYQNLLQEAAALKGLEKGTITIGSFASVTTNWLPKIITAMKERYPDIIIKVIEDDYESLENRVAAGELDCCFSIVTPNNKVHYLPLVKDKLYCIVSPEHPLAKQQQVKVKQIEKYPLIKPKAGWDLEVDELFSKHQISPLVAYEVSDDQSIIALVQANLGINIRPGLVLQQQHNAIKTLPFAGDVYRTIALATATNVSHATKRFLEVVTELFQE